ncbi:SEC10/PgrA surface exclusion domain-containing protein [Streptococcus suis]|uniref:SEC10/PgrA surface exclusion domain-containing protein n=1 Tax=Streptococcus suis TaxID=1307 RepID=UPI000CF39653|nr:SEC10/PgrA surface exclusion domain-containing protein [Streptococcus suis]
MKHSILGGVAILVAGTTGTGGVNAEETVVTTGVEELTSEANAATVTETQLGEAELAADQATEAVASQEVVVGTVESELAEATIQKEVAEGSVEEAQALVAKATPENIQKVEAGISTTESEIGTVETELAEANSEKASAEEAVAAQEKEVSATQAEVDQKEAEVKQAQELVAQAEEILAGTSNSAILKTAAEAQEELSKASQAVSEAEANLEAAKVSDSSRAERILDGQASVTEARALVEQMSQLESVAQNKVSEAEQVVSQAQTSFNQASNAYNAINTITVSTDYIAALTDYATNYSTNGQSAKAKLDSMAAGLRSQNSYKSNSDDAARTLITNSLTESEATELSLFAADLVNKIRRAMGTDEVIVTSSAIDLAGLISEGYVADDWSAQEIRTIGHDAKAVNDAARSLNLKTTSPELEAKGIQSFENMDNWVGNTSTMTMDSAKRRIYQAVINFMFNGYEYMHAESIAGLSSSGVSYFGLSFSARTDASSVHFVTVQDKQILPNSTFSKTEILGPTSDSIITSYNQAQLALTSAQTTLNQSKADLREASDARAQAELGLANAEKELATAQAIPLATPNAQAALEQANVSLNQATFANQAAQETIQVISADVETKQAHLENVQIELVKKKDELNHIKAELAEKRSILLNLEGDVTVAQTRVTRLTNDLNRLKESLDEQMAYLTKLHQSSQLLEVAEETLIERVKLVEQKKEELSVAQEKLDSLKADRDKKAKTFGLLQERYQALQEAVRQSQLANQYDSITQAGGNPIPVVDETGRVTKYVTDQPVVQPATSKAVTRVTATEGKKASLPNTGSSLSIMSFLLSSVTAGLAFLLKRKGQ